MTEKDLFSRKSQRPHYLFLSSHGYVRVLMSVPATLLTSSLSNAKSSRLPRVVTHIFVATSYSKRKGPLKGEDHQIWRLGVCLLSTQVPCGPIPMLRTPCCEGRDERRACEDSVMSGHGLTPHRNCMYFSYSTVDASQIENGWITDKCYIICALK